MLVTQIKANVNQIPPDLLVEGTKDYPAMSLLGQLWTADWRIRLILAGMCHKIYFGTITAEADISMVGNGEAIELERPECLICVDNGWLIPLSLNLAVNSDMDLEDDECDVLVTSDRNLAPLAAAVATAAGTARPPVNMLDGGQTFAGRYSNISTGDLANPVHNDVLYYKHWERLGANPKEATNMFVDKVWEFPTFLAGPCSLLLYVGATQRPFFVGTLEFAHIPKSWIAVPS